MVVALVVFFFAKKCLKKVRSHRAMSRYTFGSTLTESTVHDTSDAEMDLFINQRRGSTSSPIHGAGARLEQGSPKAAEGDDGKGEKSKQDETNYQSLAE